MSVHMCPVRSRRGRSRSNRIESLGENLTMYLLLTKTVHINGQIETNWQVFSGLEAAKLARARGQRVSDNLRKAEAENLLPMLGPNLVQSIILEVTEVR